MIGISSTEFSAYMFEEVIEKVSKAFGHWEIFAEAEHRLQSSESRFGDVMSSYNLSYSVHAPISDINIASLNERIREDSIMEILTTVESAANLGIGTVTIHPGLASMAVPYMEEKAMEKSKRSLRSIDRISSEYGMNIALENMPSYPFMLGQSSDDIRELLEPTDLKFCLDIGHSNTTGQTERFLSDHRDRLVNVHIHDNHGVHDEHLTIGEGSIDFRKVIEGLKGYSGNYVIECKSFQSGLESLEALEKLL